MPFEVDGAKMVWYPVFSEDGTIYDWMLDVSKTKKFFSRAKAQKVLLQSDEDLAQVCCVCRDKEKRK